MVTEKTGIRPPVHELDRRYATALFAVAAEIGRIDDTEAALTRLEASIDGAPELALALMSPLHSASDKAAVVQNMCDRLDGPPVLRSFLSLVASKGRVGRLRSMAQAFRIVVDGHRGVRRVAVRTARSLPPARREQLEEAIRTALGGDAGTVAIDVAVDTSLLGGVQMRMGSRLVDASVRGRLDALSRVMTGE